MSDSPAETIRLGAKEIRAKGDHFIPQGPRAQFYQGAAELLDVTASEMDEYTRVEERDSGVGIVEFLGGAFQPSKAWTAALKTARAFLREGAQ